MAEPAATPVTTPDELTVAMVASELVHGELTAAVVVAVNVVVPPIVIELFPEIVGRAKIVPFKEYDLRYRGYDGPISILSAL